MKDVTVTTRVEGNFKWTITKQNGKATWYTVEYKDGTYFACADYMDCQRWIVRRLLEVYS